MRRRGWLVAVAVAGLVFAVPAVPAAAPPAVAGPRDLVPCAAPTAGAYTVAAGVTATFDTTALTFVSGITGTVVNGVAVFGFDGFTVADTATVLVTGSRPLAILSRSTISVAGTVTVTPGQAGGGAGGVPNQPGSGPGAGEQGLGAGGGGGGFGGIGGTGGGVNFGLGGPTYGNLLTAIQGGSGGGGGATNGGAGGGAIALVANQSITVAANGIVRAQGQDAPVGVTAGGGGGSGGGIVLRAPTVDTTGLVNVTGGNGTGGTGGTGGGGGGGGRVLVLRNAGSGPSPVAAGGAGGSTGGSQGQTGIVTVDDYKIRILSSRPGVVRLSTEFHLRNALTTGGDTEPVFTFGARPQTPIMGDWNGDGVRTPGRYAGGTFYLRNSNSAGAPDVTAAFGDPRAFSVMGDWNGDGLDDVGLYRSGTWEFLTTGCGTTSTASFGAGTWPATVPVAGDWDGDGFSGIGTYDLAGGTWSLRQTADTGAANVGPVAPSGAGSYPVTGDWDADGVDGIGGKATQGTAWSLRNTATGAASIMFDYGAANDLPVTWST